MSLDNITHAFDTLYPIAVEIKTNGYVISLPIVMNPNYILSKDVIDEYTDIIHKGRALVEFSVIPPVTYQQDMEINLIDVCGLVKSIDMPNKKLTIKITDTPTGERFYTAYLMGKSTTFNLIAWKNNDSICKIIKFMATT